MARSTSDGSFSDATQANLHTNGLRKPTQAALLLCYFVYVLGAGCSVTKSSTSVRHSST